MMTWPSVTAPRRWVTYRGSHDEPADRVRDNRRCGDPGYGYAGAGARRLTVSGRRYGVEFPQGDRGEFSNGRYGLALR